ncbi:MAG TPA: 7-cyano-7-deazaguanine synthase QueC [Elusimicrobiota bacterium]|nr:7-cyano-7-deazaguanine synthase QueC [Elusimicrobiota bacterium]
MPARKPLAVVLLSGGLDSSTCLYWAKSRGYRCVALSAAYGQRHDKELGSARRLAKAARTPLHAVRLSLPWLRKSSLVDRSKRLPRTALSRIGRGKIPSTYVPGRNTIFLALAISLADAWGAEAVVIGANAVDFSGYPDCRPAFYRAFRSVFRQGTRRGSSGKPVKILAPLLKLNKAGIARLARKLRVPLRLTWSCYAGLKKPCGVCDSCKLRAKGFAQAGFVDPAV